MRLVPTVRPTRRVTVAMRRPHLMHRSTPMLDVLMVALAFGLFAAAIGYTYACERL